MTSYKFEVIAKNEIIRLLKGLFNEDFSIDQVQLVWFSKVLNHWKGTFIDNGSNNRYYEVTYNRMTNEMYFDMYEKTNNSLLLGKDFNDKVEPIVKEPKEAPRATKDTNTSIDTPVTEIIADLLNLAGITPSSTILDIRSGKELSVQEFTDYLIRELRENKKD